MDVCKSKNITVFCSIANEFCLINYQNGNSVFYRQYPSLSQENSCYIENVCFCYNDQYIAFTDSEKSFKYFWNEKYDFKK